MQPTKHHCNVCDTSYTTKQSLKRHMNSIVHKNVLENKEKEEKVIHPTYCHTCQKNFSNTSCIEKSQSNKTSQKKRRKN